MARLALEAVQMTSTYGNGGPSMDDSSSTLGRLDLISLCVRCGKRHAAGGSGGMAPLRPWWGWQLDMSYSQKGTPPCVFCPAGPCWQLPFEGSPLRLSGNRASGIGGSSKLPTSTLLLNHSSASVCRVPSKKLWCVPSKVDLSLKLSSAAAWADAEQSFASAVCPPEQPGPASVACGPQPPGPWCRLPAHRPHPASSSWACEHLDEQEGMATSTIRSNSTVQRHCSLPRQPWRLPLSARTSSHCGERRKASVVSVSEQGSQGLASALRPPAAATAALSLTPSESTGLSTAPAADAPWKEAPVPRLRHVVPRGEDVDICPPRRDCSDRPAVGR
mmetsp:Transcript_107001/g.320022  ORF Transcript_107001/g.320022 Transcript_107001/m.320022 type:complete len:332 (+) Transcript_107001:357-1352(+)